jgi:flagellar biogenesis protein FliO
MSKLQDDLQKINNEIDATADKGLQAAQKSSYTGWILFGILALIVFIVWFIGR